MHNNLLIYIDPTGLTGQPFFYSSNDKTRPEPSFKTFKSGLCGIGHGLIDFGINTLHDFQMAAVHIGSADFEMSHRERMDMIRTVENSHSLRISSAGNHLMNFMEIDANDMNYHSFRSNTTTTLEIGSLALGVYNLAKGAIAFTRLARASRQIVNVANQSTKVLERSHGFSGRKGNELKNFFEYRSRNKSGTVYGRSYRGHAFDQMENRGIMPSVVEEAIKTNSYCLGKEPGTISYYDKVNNVTIILNNKGQVVTTSFGDIKQ